MRINQLTDRNAVEQIVNIVTATLPQYSKDYYIQSKITNSEFGVYVWIGFMRADPKYAGWAAEQSMDWKVRDGVLYISDTYIPESFRGKGFLSAVLKRVRQIPELKGEAVVHVAVNNAWPKILQQAGFSHRKP